MERTMKRALVFTMIGLFLLAACAPAQAATQDPMLSEQVSELSGALTSAAQNPSATQPPDPQLALLQQTFDSFLATQTAQATPTMANELDVDLQQTIEADATAQEGAFLTMIALTSTELNRPTAVDTPDNTETPEPTGTDYPLYITATQGFDTCNLFISDQAYSFPTRLPLQDFKNGDSVIIVSPVNLRTGPSLSSTILMTLNPDPNTTFTIVGGPAYSNFTNNEDLGSEDSPYIVTNRKYKWWRIQFPGKTTTGWVAEASACGDYNYILEGTPAS